MHSHALIALVTTLITIPANGQIHFDAPTPYEDPRWPFDVRGGDFDLDGDTDVAVTLRGENLIRVMWNDGAGTFSANSYLPTHSEPTNLIVADINGDGGSDILNSNFGSATVTTWLNDGTGVFVEGPSISVGSLPHDVKAIDLDADGDRDLVVANAGDGTVSRFLNDGSGNFGTGIDLPTGGQPHHFVVADLDGDADPDIAVMEFLNGKVFIFKNDGSAGFTESQVVALGHQSFRMESLDVDSDGDIDLMPGGALLQNNGLGVFVQLPYPDPVPGDLADADCDGCIDGLSGQGDGTLLMLECLSVTGPETTREFSLSDGVREARFIDVNGDGYADVVAAVGPWLGGPGGIIDVAINMSSPACQADIVPNGVVDLNDLLLVIGFWGLCDGDCETTCFGDTNGDCVVDLADLLAVIGNWGSTCG